MELECRRMCQGALKGFAGTLSVSLNCCLHGDTFYLYCWPVGFEGISWVQFYFQIPISHLYLSLFQLSYQIDSHKHSWQESGDCGANRHLLYKPLKWYISQIWLVERCHTRTGYLNTAGRSYSSGFLKDIYSPLWEETQLCPSPPSLTSLRLDLLCRAVPGGVGPLLPLRHRRTGTHSRRFPPAGSIPFAGHSLTGKALGPPSQSLWPLRIPSEGHSRGFPHPPRVSLRGWLVAKEHGGPVAEGWHSRLGPAPAAVKVKPQIRAQPHFPRPRGCK